MSKKKFRPRISRIKLNVEQAVLACSCYSAGIQDYYNSGEFIAYPDGYVCHSGRNQSYVPYNEFAWHFSPPSAASS